jgi:tetratricopeptide (TPR) repeat protein
VLSVIGCSSKEEKVRISVEQDYNKAIDLAKKEDYEQAKELLQKCINQLPKEGKYNFALGNIYRNTQEHIKAEGSYLAAIEKSPQLKEAYNNLAGTYMLQGKYDDASKILDDGLERFPNFSELIFKKAQLIFFEKQYNKTIELMSRVIDQPNYVEGYRFIGLSYLNLGDSVKGLENLKIYLEKTPDTSAGKKEIEELVKQLEKEVSQ